jgi:hypothetical protein
MQPLPVRAARQMLDTLASNPALSNLILGVSFFEVLLNHRQSWVRANACASNG